MTPNSLPPPVLVAACGNTMAGDDAFGPRVAAALRRKPCAHREVVDLGLKPAGLTMLLSGRRGLILVDAAQTDGASDSLIEIEFFAANRPQLVHDAGLSSHKLSFAHELELARQIGLLPECVWLIAAPLQTAELGAGMSDVISRLVPQAVHRIVQRTDQWMLTWHSLRQAPL